MFDNIDIARQYAWDLAQCLMALVVLFRQPSGYAVLPASDYEGTEEDIIHAYDPF